MVPVTFAELYEAHAAAVHRFALALSGRAADAEDITSETFIRAWSAPGEIRLPTLRAYLLTIARNVYLQGLRVSRRTAPLGDGESLASPAHGAEREVAGREELAAVARAFAKLPEIDRSAVGMRLDGLSIEEIAASLAVTPVAAKVRIHRARLKLAAILAASEGETPWMRSREPSWQNLSPFILRERSPLRRTPWWTRSSHQEPELARVVKHAENLGQDVIPSRLEPRPRGRGGEFEGTRRELKQQ